MDALNEPNKIRSVAAIVNPIAGSGSRKILLRQVAELLARKGCRLDVHLTGGPGAAGRIVRSLHDKADAFVVVGGDGTVRDVSSGLVDHPKPLLIIPGGTENLVARDMKASTDAHTIVQTILGGRVVVSDLGFVNERPFLIVTGVGFDAVVVNRLARIRRGHITQLSYFWPTWRTFWDHHFPRFRVVADGELIFDGRGLAFVGLSRQYASRLVILPYARRDRGMLDICVFPCRNRAQLLIHTARVLSGTHARSSVPIHARAKTVEITSDAVVPMEADGDSAGNLPARFRIVEKTVQLLVPAPPS